MMTTTRAMPIRRVPVPVPSRAIEGNRDVRLDPATLGATLRDVAARAHRAVRALDAASEQGDCETPPATDPLQDLAALYPRIVHLQRSVDEESQHGLAAYLSALRHEVESRLA
jgi:hypothetical protein